MATDHYRLPILVQRAVQDVEHTDLLSSALIAPLVHHLLAHFHREETEVFPRAERIAGDPRFLQAASLRREHVVLRELLRDIEAALTRRDCAEARGNLLELGVALVLHSGKEDALFLNSLDTFGQP